jgi:hypothetical protein
MPDPKPTPRKPAASEKNVLNIDVPTLMVILSVLILLPLLATGFMSQ